MSLLSLFVLFPLGFMLTAILAGRHGALLIFAAAPAMIALAFRLLLVLDEGSLGGGLGGWPAPLGIRLDVSGFSAALLVASSITASLIGLYARSAFEMSGHAAGTRGATFWPLFFGLWAGMNAVLVSNDVFNLYVSIELLTITAVALVAYGSPRAALRYLLVAMPASLLFLLGVVFLYARYATLDIALLSKASVADLPTFIAAAAMSAGLMVKAALFPLHAWLPPAQGSAPAPVSALLSALVEKAGFFILLRLWFEALPALPDNGHVFGALGCAAILYGSLLALRQRALKKIIAYSTVAQLGYLFLVFPLAGAGGPAAPWAAGAWGGMALFALAHIFSKAGMFLAAGLMIQCAGDGRVDALRGIARTMPVTVFGFAVCAVSLMGLPPSGGFLAKYLLMTTALSAGLWIYALVILAGGLLAAAYLFRPLSHFMDARATPEITPRPQRVLPAIPLVLGLLSVGLGLVSAPAYTHVQIGAPERTQASMVAEEAP